VLIAVQLLIGFCSAVSFGPLIADISHWFLRRRGIAVAIAASGNYLSGAIWPVVLAPLLAAEGWRAVNLALAVILVVVIVRIFRIVECIVRPVEFQLALRLGKRGKNRGDLATDQLGRGIERRDAREFVRRLLHALDPELLVLVFPAAELQRKLHLVRVVEEILRPAELRLEVVRVDRDPELHFLEARTVLLVVLLLFALLVEVFAEVEDAADRRLGSG